PVWCDYRGAVRRESAVIGLIRSANSGRERRAFRPMWAKGSTVGPRCTGSTLLVCTGWHWKKDQAETGITGAPKKGLAFREIAEVIGRRLKCARRQQVCHGGRGALWLVRELRTVDAAASSEWTQRELGWKPTQPGLIADLDQPHYFQTPRAAALQ